MRLSQSRVCPIVFALLSVCCSFVLSKNVIASIKAPVEQLYWAEEVVRDLHHPWAMTWLPDGDMLITERLGEIRVVRNDRLVGLLQGTPRIPDTGPFDGLFAIALDPDFRRNHLLYLTYTDEQSRAARIGRILRARLEGNQLLDGRVIFTASPAVSTIGPIMMRIVFLPDETMLVGVGAADFNEELAQRTDNHIGKIIRINRDGIAPSDNPFSNVSGALPEIWVTGLRNPSGLARMNDGSIWVTDIGPKGGDELNRLVAGSNYGWPLATWGFDYSGKSVSNQQQAPGFVSPVLVWSPSHTPSDLIEYRGQLYPFWNGDLFTGGLTGLSVRRIRIREGQVVLQERMLSHLNERFRSVQVGPDNFIYLITDGSSGRLLRLRPGAPQNRDQSRLAKPSTQASDPPSWRQRERAERRMRLSNAAEKYPYDPATGKSNFEKHCSACHRFQGFGVGQIGPDLGGIGTRQSGEAPGFEYSPALSDSTSKVLWSRDTLVNFIADPQSYFPGTKMPVGPSDPIVLSSIVNFILHENGLKDGR